MAEVCGFKIFNFPKQLVKCDLGMTCIQIYQYHHLSFH